MVYENRRFEALDEGRLIPQSTYSLPRFRLAAPYPYRRDVALRHTFESAPVISQHNHGGRAASEASTSVLGMHLLGPHVDAANESSTPRFLEPLWSGQYCRSASRRYSKAVFVIGNRGLREQTEHSDILNLQCPCLLSQLTHKLTTNSSTLLEHDPTN